MSGSAQGQESAQTPHVSPEPVAHLSQNRLAALLLPCAGGDVDSVLMGHAVTLLEQQGGGGGPIMVRGRDAAGLPFHVSCDYAVAADGANSSLRWAARVHVELHRTLAVSPSVQSGTEVVSHGAQVSFDFQLIQSAADTACHQERYQHVFEREASGVPAGTACASAWRASARCRAS